MRVIYKYPITDQLDFMLPIDAKVLSVQLQNDIPCMWVWMDPEAEKVMRKFIVFGTGELHSIEGTFDFIGTFQQQMFVWHLFEIIKLGL